MIDASLDTKQKSCNIDTKKLVNGKSNAKGKSNCLEKDDTEQSHSVIKNHVTKARINHLRKKSKSNIKSLEERRLNKAENLSVKVRRYSGAFFLDIIGNIKQSLRKEPDEIISHAGTNDIKIYQIMLTI